MRILRTCMGPLLSGAVPAYTQQAARFACVAQALGWYDRPVTKKSQERRGLATLIVRPAARLPGQMGPRGHVKAGQVTLACALGRGGVFHDKREGDGATPFGDDAGAVGLLPPRPDAPPVLPGAAACFGAKPRLVRRRPPRRATIARRSSRWPGVTRRCGGGDGLYDVVFVLDFNMSPRRAGRGQRDLPALRQARHATDLGLRGAAACRHAQAAAAAGAAGECEGRVTGPRFLLPLAGEGGPREAGSDEGGYGRGATATLHLSPIALIRPDFVGSPSPASGRRSRCPTAASAKIPPARRTGSRTTTAP